MRYCPNGSCPARIFSGLVHFASRGAMDIRGLGERTVRQLLDAELVHDIADLYTLSAEQLLDLEGFGEVSANNLIEAIQASKELPLSRLLFGLGIRHVGATAAQLLARHFGTMDALMEADVEDFAAIHGIGETTAEALAAYLSEPRNRDVIERLRAAGLTFEEPIEREEAPALRGADLRHHRHASDHEPQGGHGLHGAARRARDGERLQDHGLPRRRREPRIQTGTRARAGRTGTGRGGLREMASERESEPEHTERNRTEHA